MFVKRMKKRKHLYLISFFLSFAISASVFLLLGITPFGEKILYISDLGAQYMPFLSYLKELSFTSPASFLYSFSNGLGDGFIPMAAYYLMSPFNVLTFSSSTVNLPTTISLIILLKLSCMSISMTFYLSKTFGRRDVMICFLAVSYSLSAFVTSYFYNIMWLDALIWLPIVTYGLQRLIDQKKPFVYLFALFMAVVTNYYMGYMICLFMVLYFIYWTLRQASYSSVKHYLIANRSAFFRFVCFSILAASLAGVLLIPTVYGMLQTGKSEVDPSIFSLEWMFGPEVFSQVGLGGINFTTRLQHLPALFSGSLVTILAVFYFLARQISKRDKILRASMLLILFLSMWIKLLYSIWHMFQKTAGFPFRNAFVFIFFLTILAYESWIHNNKKAHFYYFKISLVIITLLILGYFTNNFLASQGGTYPLLERTEMIISAFFILLIGFCLYRMRKASLKEARSFFVFLLCFAVFAELGSNFYQMLVYAPLAKKSAYEKYVTDYESAIQEIKSQDQSFYRIEDNVTQRQDYIETTGYNDSFLLHYYSNANYSSTLNLEIQQLFSHLGLFSRNERRISYVGKTQLTDLLFNTKYQLTREAEEAIAFQRNENAIGPSFTVPQQLQAVQLSQRKPFENQNQIYQVLTASKEELFHPVELEAIKEDQKSGKYYYTLTLKAIQTGSLYAYLPGNYQKYSQIKVNGKVIPSKMLITNKAVLSFGEVNAGEQWTIELTSEDAFHFEKEQFQVLQNEQMNKLQRDLASQTLTIESWENGFIKGEITVSQNEILYLSVPYDEQWRVKINGQNKHSVKLMGSMMGIPLEPGENKLELTYIPKGFYLGLVLSVSLFGILCCMLIYKYRILVKTKKSSNTKVN